ncbi:MAG: hypothetical protein GQ576_07100 [Methanococcoides sp.]|nr:hypothetical protein [Methanococcoides sp.]
MSITKILTNKDTSAEDKLEAVAAIVAGARSNYGNEDADIAVPRAYTTNGDMPFDMLDDDSKVSLLVTEVGRVKADAVEYAEQNSGVNLNKKIEELLATNGRFANIDSGTKFEYI